MKAWEIRRAYLDFFAARGHHIVPSSSLVPLNDPTLLFTNSGMVQFKDALLGREKPGYTRATSSQRCVRAGGKHNDLENVGYTARHHTFFEMLGNFSFGDYFKTETIHWAWEFVTTVLKIPRDKIWVTVHPSDDESRAIWRDEIGIPADRIVDIEDNFWTMGDTGPCGPCTEIFYDHGPEVAGGPPGSPDEDGDRYIEFWNLVFPQFDRAADGTLSQLPQRGVDTGMGLERVAAILQGVHSNYDIDLFTNLIRAVEREAGIGNDPVLRASPSVRVIADHIRSSAFLIADGVMPGNEDRAYVLRRIIRRALRHGHKLGIEHAFFHRLVADLVLEMGDAYPLLREKQAEVERALEREERKFAETLSQGMTLLNREIAELEGDVIPGELVFRLYDTYGFPADLTADVARERGLTVDTAGFDRAMEAQRDRGRAATRFSANLGQIVHTSGKVEFAGYAALDGQAMVAALHDMSGAPVTHLLAGEEGIVVLDRTPFYAESGGQVGDTGTLAGDGIVFEVTDTQKAGEQHLHVGRVQAGRLGVGQVVSAQVDADRRASIRRNHSATHLMHAALRRILGAHVQQKGSLVDAERLRFDFSHPGPVSADELARIETLVNAEIVRNDAVRTEELGYDDAVQRGAMALFGEKYGDRVRVLTMNEGYSVELCGGTHVARTGDVGLFKIISEAGVAAGVRRIEAVTGSAAVARVLEQERALRAMAELLRTPVAELEDKLGALLQEQRRLQKEAAELAQKVAAVGSGDLAGRAVEVAGVQVVAATVDGGNAALMPALDTLKSRLGSAVLVLAAVDEGKVSLVVSVSKDITSLVKAGELVNLVGEDVGAKGGGRPELARAGGGTQPDALTASLAKVVPYLQRKLDSGVTA
ncbi:MAG: alanine--tRNA ligase [Pseudomonadales bacterium]|nr:alanine--tRNA ligase [Pseudomonadales bacterium]MCP5182855.1 alanine--tRNA ligase [Pseudomonadales bacterium]